MVYRDPKKHEIPEHLVANSGLCPKKKGKKAIFNHDFLTAEYQQVMLSQLFRVPSLASQPLKILHLGTGAGLLPMFLVNQLENLEKITTVDVSGEMLQVAEKMFGFNPNHDKI